MKRAASRVPARYFALLCEVLDAKGVSVDDVLKAAHLDAKKIERQNHTITPHQVELLLDEAIRISGRSDLAFELGRRITLHSHDILSFALLSSGTLDQMLRLFARYHRLMAPMLTLHYQRRGDHAELLVQPAVPMKPQTRQFLLETAAVSMHTQVESALQVRPQSSNIFISIDSPQHVARYAELGTAKFHFAPSPMQEVRIHIAGAGLDMPMPGANAAAVRLAEERCELLLGGANESESWAEWVGTALRKSEDGMPTLEHLAAMVNISSRTLHRHLRGEGTSFRDIAAQVRIERARALLADGDLAVSQIAYALGYTDLASFSRSFKKMNGVSPTIYRGRYQSGQYHAA